MEALLPVVEPEALPETECTVVDGAVDGGTASFIVGPEGCVGQVGPISFSTYDLPSGVRKPYEAQVLIAHAVGNGGFYSAGSYVLSASLADASCWQSDLYFGQSDDQPPLPQLIAYDYHECDVVPSSSSTTTTTTTTTSTTTTTTTSPAALSSSTTSPPVPVTTPTAVGPDSGTATTQPAAVALAPTTAPRVASAGPTTTAAPGAQTLPATGQSTVVLLTIAAAGTGIGLLTRRLARRPAA
jgi:hypothetical protein